MFNTIVGAIAFPVKLIVCGKQVTGFVALLTMDANRQKEGRVDWCCCFKSRKFLEEVGEEVGKVALQLTDKDLLCFKRRYRYTRTLAGVSQ